MKTIVDGSFVFSPGFPGINPLDQGFTLRLKGKIDMCCCTTESCSSVAGKEVVRGNCTAEWHFQMGMRINPPGHYQKAFRIDNFITATNFSTQIPYSCYYSVFNQNISFNCVSGGNNCSTLNNCTHNHNSLLYYIFQYNSHLKPLIN